MGDTFLNSVHSIKQFESSKIRMTNFANTTHNMITLNNVFTRFIIIFLLLILFTKNTVAQENKNVIDVVNVMFMIDDNFFELDNKIGLKDYIDNEIIYNTIPIRYTHRLKMENCSAPPCLMYGTVNADGELVSVENNNGDTIHIDYENGNIEGIYFNPNINGKPIFKNGILHQIIGRWELDYESHFRKVYTITYDSLNMVSDIIIEFEEKGFELIEELDGWGQVVKRLSYKRKEFTKMISYGDSISYNFYTEPDELEFDQVKYYSKNDTCHSITYTKDSAIIKTIFSDNNLPVLIDRRKFEVRVINRISYRELPKEKHENVAFYRNNILLYNWMKNTNYVNGKYSRVIDQKLVDNNGLELYERNNIRARKKDKYGYWEDWKPYAHLHKYLETILSGF